MLFDLNINESELVILDHTTKSVMDFWDLCYLNDIEAVA